MNSTASREERARAYYAAKPAPSAEVVADVSLSIMDAYQTFRFLIETFGALRATEVELTLSSDAAAGLSHMCEKVAEDLIDAYGRL